jgi:hypothetical protein
MSRQEMVLALRKTCDLEVSGWARHNRTYQFTYSAVAIALKYLGRLESAGRHLKPSSRLCSTSGCVNKRPFALKQQCSALG